MSIKSAAAKLLAKRDVKRMNTWIQNPIDAQNDTKHFLYKNLLHTAYGKHLGVSSNGADSWTGSIPLVSYEDLLPFIERIKNGEENILWPGKPLYLCTTSGTTAGSKYIPLTRSGIEAQVLAARNALLAYMYHSGNQSFVDGKMIFLQGSPTLEHKNGIGIGRLSGIVAHHVPNYLQRNRMPSWETNCIEDWSDKVDKVVDETVNANMTLISGIPPWVQMYFERLLEKSGKNSIGELFPNFSLFVHGGVNFKPYSQAFNALIGTNVDTLETYPASEGFIGFQEDHKARGMLLNLAAGIYYEFIPVTEYHNNNPNRLSIEDVEIDVNYVIVLNTSSGLWGYVIGDTVKFVSTHPFRIEVTGRIAHYISAFGEHVIAEEVEGALSETAKHMEANITEFHVAPQVAPSDGLPYHEWFIEVDEELPNGFDLELDQALCKRNKYYKDLITGEVLRPLKITSLPRGSFNRYMDSIGKLGGQNKLPRLANDRNIADKMSSDLS